MKLSMTDQDKSKQIPPCIQTKLVFKHFCFGLGKSEKNQFLQPGPFLSLYLSLSSFSPISSLPSPTPRLEAGSRLAGDLWPQSHAPCQMLLPDRFLLVRDSYIPALPKSLSRWWLEAMRRGVPPCTHHDDDRHA